jgi:HEAT repeat protein
MGKSRDPRVVEPLGAARKDESWQVREAAGWALERIGDKQGLEPLVLILADKNPLVRKESDGGDFPYGSVTATWRFNQVFHTL